MIQGEANGKPKVRPIDDYKASQVNACVTQTEQVTIHSMDVVAGTIAYWLRCSQECKCSSDILAKCWDLKSAYKQLPLTDTSLELDSYFVIFSPTAKEPRIFRQLVLPFGSVASVTGFIRAALGLWVIALVHLTLVWTMYFDDFLHLSSRVLCRHSDMIISMFFQLLGWRVSKDKLLDYSSCCKALGILIDLKQASFGKVFFTNTDSRRSELLDALEKVLETGTLKPKDCERLKGRLQFASGQLFGRKARSCLKTLGLHSSKASHEISAATRNACEHLRDLFLEAAPREVRGSLGDVFHCFVDASFEPNEGFSGIGGCLYSSTGKAVAWFGCEVDHDSVKLILESGEAERSAAIYELECVAVAVALEVFGSYLAHKNVVLFTDNQGVQGTLIRCWSENRIGNGLARLICCREEKLQSFLWLERVPSSSNPSDAPSRGCEPAGAFKERSEVPPGMVPGLLREALRLDAL